MSKKPVRTTAEPSFDSPVVQRLDELDRKMSAIHAGISDVFRQYAPVMEGRSGAASDPPAALRQQTDEPRIEATIEYLHGRADDAIARLADLVERAQC